MRLLRTFEDSKTDLVDLEYAWDRRTFFMIHANGAYVQIRYVGDSDQALNAARKNITEQAAFLGRRSPPAEAGTLYQPGDECYGPNVKAYGEIGDSSRDFLKSVWVFIDPIPHPEMFPNKRFGVKHVLKVMHTRVIDWINHEPPSKSVR
jgi:hypothetical protein